MKILAIDHVQLAMPAGQEEKARAFYINILGFTEIPKPPELAKRGGAWFQSENVQLHLGIESDFRSARKAHPAFIVDDLNAIVEKVQRAGLTPSLKRFSVQDMNGMNPNRLWMDISARMSTIHSGIGSS